MSTTGNINYKTATRSKQQLNKIKKANHDKKGRIKSPCKNARINKEEFGMSNWQVPEDMEKAVLEFEKKHGRFTTIDDLATIFQRMGGKSPHSHEANRVINSTPILSKFMTVDGLYDSDGLGTAILDTGNAITHGIASVIPTYESSSASIDPPGQGEASINQDHNTDFSLFQTDGYFSRVSEVLKSMRTLQPEMEQYLSVIEDICMLGYIVYRQTDPEIILLFVLQIIKRMMQGSISQFVFNYIHDLFTPSTNQQSTTTEPQVDKGPQGENIIRDSITQFKQFRSSQFMKKLNELLSLGIVCGFAKPVEISLQGVTLFSNTGLAIASKSDDFFGYCIDMVGYFFSTGYDFFRKDYSAFWTYDEAAQLENEIIFLSSNIQRVACGALEKDTGVKTAEYQARLMAAFNTARYLANNTADKIYRSIMNAKVDKLSKLMVSFEQSVPLEGMREAPFSFCVFGASSVGKSTVVNSLMCSVLKYNENPSDDINICVLQPNDRFYSTYRADTQAVLLDDVANVKTDKAEANPCDMIISLVNNIMYYAPKAELAEKGKIKVEPRVVAVTTNVKNLKAQDWSNEPISIIRRLKYHLTVRVHAEYATKSGKLDPTKITSDMHTEFKETGFMDVWSIDIEEVVGEGPTLIGGSEGYRFAAILWRDKMTANLNIYEVAAFLNEQSAIFYEQQRNMKEGCKNVGQKQNFCKKCMFPQHKCTCTLCPKGPQAFAIEKPVQWASDILVSSIKDKLWSQTKWLRPTLFDYFVLDRTATYAVKQVADQIADDYLTLAHWIPLKYRTNKYVESFYYYMNRRNIVLTSTAFAVVGSLFTFTKCRDYGCSRTKSGFFASMIGGFHFAIAHRVAYYDILNNLRQAPVHQIVEQKKTQQAGEIFLKVGVSLAVGTVVITTIKSLYGLMFSRPHGNLCPVTPEDIEARDKEANVWQKQVVSYLPKCPLSTNMTSEHLINRLEANCFHIVCEDQRTVKKISAIALRSNIFACPKHFFHEKNNLKAPMLTGHYDASGFKKGYLNVKLFRSDSLTGNYFRATIYLDSLFQVGEHDLVLFSLPSGGTLPDIVPFFCEGYYSGAIRSICRDSTGSLNKMYGVCDTRKTSYYAAPNMRDLITIYKGGDVLYSGVTRRGMCTAMLVSDTKNPEIIGLHVAGVENTSSGSYLTVTKSELTKTIHELHRKTGNLEVHSAGEFVPFQYGKDLQYTEEISPQSPVNYIENHNYMIRGSIGTGSTYYSDVRRSILCDAVEKTFDIKCEWGKPKFYPQRWKPWFTFLDTAAEYSPSLDPYYLKLAKEDYLKPLVQMMKIYATEDNMSPLTMKEVINGKPGVRFIDKWNFSTSIGYPLTGRKSIYLEGEIGDFSFHDPEMFYEEIDKMEQAYLRGERYYAIFKACLKDEPTKVTKDKVRVFHAASAALQLGWRRYGLPVLRALSLYPLLSECAVGINPFNEEWNQMHQHVTFAGNADNRIVAGDYSKWDIRLPPELITMAFQIIIELAKASGFYTERDLTMLRGLATDTTYYACHFNGTLLEMCGGVPSGHNLTAHINSIANSLLIRCGFFTAGNFGDFRKHCHFMTYGDDFFGGVTTQVKKFDHLIYKTFLAQHGIVLTMPIKDAEATQFMHIKECDFLKRRSVLCPYDGLYYGALDVNSLLKSLMVRTKIKISERHHAYNAISMFLRELSYHDEETYEYYRRGLAEIAEENSICVFGLHMTHKNFYRYRQGLDDHFLSPDGMGDMTSSDTPGYPETQEARESQFLLISEESELTTSAGSLPESAVIKYPNTTY